jgi:sterol desaturase/sphingolipid hydroxylase (fatty acid hydroxylase superfamily)
MRELISSFAIFWVLGFMFFAVEGLFPAREIRYRSVLLRDLVALGIYNLFFLIALRLTDRIPVPHYLPAAIISLPLAYKLVLFYVIEDFGLYWVHRLMHTKYVWRVHKWHHSPTYMYWLAGIRTTLPHILLFNLAFVAALPLLIGAPGWVFQLVAVEHIIRNNWMHMNVTWNSRLLEWVFVTPRYHHIHHSDAPAHLMRNLGSLLTVWDRIFGTFFDPYEARERLSFGINQKVHPVRLILGV